MEPLRGSEDDLTFGVVEADPIVPDVVGSETTLFLDDAQLDPGVSAVCGVLPCVLEQVGRENLQARLMLEQARASMSRHSADLRLEAGRWSALLKGFHRGDDCYDYFKSELHFFRTPGEDSTIPVCFSIHLMHGFPETYQKFRDWEKQVPSYRAGVLSLWREWLAVVSTRLVREKRLHEGAYGKKYSLSDHNRIRFASTLWREIFKDSLKGYPSLRDKDKSLGFPLIEIRMKAGFCRSSYLSQEIASGTREWVNRATVLHQRIYHENKYSLPEEIGKRGLLGQKNRLKDLALETSSMLDIVSSGGAIFKPGDCYFCARLLF